MLTIAIVQRHLGEALHRGVPIPLFFGGILCGAAMVDTADGHAQVRRAVIVEALLLTLFASVEWITDGRVRSSFAGSMLMLLFLSGSMGLQNAALA